MNDHNYRESAVYVHPDIEGFLDKKEIGVLRTKTSRRWCWIQGSIFYQQKQQTNNGIPGGIDVLDMADVHYVKNLSADTTGTQFEIFVKKSQVYICSSREECTAWIKALHKAIAIKEFRRPDDSNKASKFFTPLGNDNGVYSDILDRQVGRQSPPPEFQNGHAKMEDHYTTPQDCVENVYCDLSDVNVSQNKTETVETVPNTVLTSRQPASNHNQSVPLDSCYAEGYSTGPQASDLCYANGYSIRAEENYSCYSDTVSTGSTEQSKFMKKDSVKEQKPSSLKPSRKAPVAPHVKNGVPSPTGVVSQPTSSDSVKDTGEVEKAINSEDQLIEIFNAMDTESEVPDLEYIVTNDDAKPVVDLKTYLRQNDVHCRVSTNRLSHSQDPIASCKSYLTLLDGLM